MRNALSAFVFGAMAIMVGCSADGDGSLLTKGGARDSASASTDGSKNGGSSTSPTAAAVTPAVAACSAVAAPTSLSDAKDASDIHVAGTGVFFQSGTSVNRVLKTGENKAAIFTSENLVRSFVDQHSLLTVEQTSTDDPTATLRVFQADEPKDDDGNPTGVTPPFPTFPVNTDGDDPGGTTANTNFNAPGTNVFGADDNNFYLTADDGNGNSEIIQVDRNDLTQTVLVNSDKVISSPQVASDAIWYVLDNQRVFMIALATDDQAQGTPTEMFGQGNAQCNLAVTSLNAFCSVGSEIDSRDLTGASPKTLLTEQQSKVTGAGFGLAMANAGNLFVRDNSADPQVQHVIRMLTTGDSPSESFIACNRGQVTGIAVDSDAVAWTENGAGVFVTKRQ